MANQLNVAALLFMCNILPAYAASGNMPSIVLERPLLPRTGSTCGVTRRHKTLRTKL